MKSALLKDIFREIGRSRSRFFSIFAIIALGAGFFAGLNITCPDMLVTQERYFERNNLMDIRLVSTYGFDEKDMEAIENTEGIRQIYATYSKDVFVKNENNASVIAKIMAVPDEGMNNFILVEGRMPRNPGECLVEKNERIEKVHRIGDTVSVYTTDPDDPLEDSLENDSWTVVGVVMSPQYINYDRGNTTIGDGSTDTYIMVPKENFKYEVYTEVYITLDSTKGIPSFDEEYSAAVEIAVEDFEAVADIREVARLEEIKSEAYDEINEAKEKIADAEAELADAEAELADAFAELTDAEAELSDGWDEYYDGLKEYREGKAEFEEEIAKAEKKIYDGERSLARGVHEYSEGVKQYEEGKAAFDAALAENNMTVEGLYQNREMVEGMLENSQGNAMMEAYLNSMLAQLNESIAAYEALESARISLEDGAYQLGLGVEELEDGRKELEEAKAEGEKELADAKKELDEGYAELKDGEKELADGWNEYYDGLEEFEDAKAEAEEEIADAKKEIADAEEELADLKDPVWYVFTREDNPGYNTYESDVYIIDSVGRVFPFFFFLVAMLVCLTTMTRMVEEQRTQIGTMKALGYGKGAIMSKFIVYSSVASVCGAVFGIGVCAFLFPLVIYSAYAIAYIVPELEFTLNPLVWILVVAVCVLCTTLAVVMSCYAELRSNPAELMRPKAPKAGKRVLLERIPFIWKRLNFTKKVTVRNLFRYKKRIFMTILGIAGCAALTLTGFGIHTSVSAVLDKQYSEIFNYDLIVALDTDAGAEEVEKAMEEIENNKITEVNLPAYMKTVKYGGVMNISLIAAEDSEAIEQMVLLRSSENGEKYTLDNEGVIITERLANIFGLSAGDEITFECDERIFTAKISAIAENYAMHFIYMTKDLYEELCGEEMQTNAMFTIMTDDGAEAQDELANTLTEYDGVLALSFARTAKESFSETVESLNYVVILIILCAAALAFVVLYNLTNINITERIREIATIKVLGFYDGEVSAYVFRENLILSIMGAGVGLVLGVWLHTFVIMMIQTNDVMFGSGLPLWTYIAAFAMTVLFAFIVNWMMFFRLKKISMVESLKSVE